MKDAEKFFEIYCDFVTKVTSDPSLKIDDLKKSLEDIQDNSIIDVPRLLTAALGLGSETGEFVEIVKKMILQGKPADADNIFHMKRDGHCRGSAGSVCACVYARACVSSLLA